MVKLNEIFFGKKPKLKQMPNYTQGQTSFMDTILQMLQDPTEESISWLKSLFGDEGFEDFERPLLEQFEQQTIPSILERFTGGGARSSSGLNQALAQAGRGLSGDIAAQRSGLRMQAMNPLQNFANIGLNKQTTPYQTSGTQGVFGGLQQQGGNLLRQWLSGGF